MRPHLEAAASIDMGDGAAAGANGANIDHGDEDRITANPGIARRGLAILPVDDNTDVGAGAADVEGNEAAPSRKRRCPCAA